jgi:hypothetical protein
MLAGNLTSFPYRNARISEPLAEIEPRSSILLPFALRTCSWTRKNNAKVDVTYTDWIQVAEGGVQWTFVAIMGLKAYILALN